MLTFNGRELLRACVECRRYRASVCALRRVFWQGRRMVAGPIWRELS
jgi:hypothetical protein